MKSDKQNTTKMISLDNTDYNNIRTVFPFNLLNRICSTRGILLFAISSSLFFIFLIIIPFTTQQNIGDILVSFAFSPLRMTRNIKEFETTLRGLNHPLRVMTFNIWVSGANVKDGLKKIAKHIAKVDADIVALQVNF
jgi:hypothetical protein